MKMERDQNLEGQPLANFDLQEPHFNDERTIQTARPVVPLNPFWRILTKRRIAFAGAFMLAALLGAGSALALIQLRRPVDVDLSEAAKTEETEPVATTEAQPSEDLNQSSTEAIVVESDLNKSAETTEPAQRKVRPRHSRTVLETPESMPKVTISVKSNDSPQARLVDEWQERRQRRVARPERPNNHYQRDLFRIREIFEGPRRRP
jgi:hypothetical protein